MITDAMRRALAGEPPAPGVWHPAYGGTIRADLQAWLEHGPEEHALVGTAGVVVPICCATSEDTSQWPSPTRELVRVRVIRQVAGDVSMCWWVAVDDLGRSIASSVTEEVSTAQVQEAVIFAEVQAMLGTELDNGQ